MNLEAPPLEKLEDAPFRKANLLEPTSKVHSVSRFFSQKTKVGFLEAHVLKP